MTQHNSPLSPAAKNTSSLWPNSKLALMLSRDPSSKARLLEDAKAGRADPAKQLHDWNQWARGEQLPPPGDWRIWLFLGGRGAGKTRAGAEWVRAQVAAGARRIALVGPAFQDVREVMLGGPSGLLALGPEPERPSYEVSRRRVVWPGGAVGYAFSAEDPDGLRGPQFDAAWADEFAAWARPQDTLDMLRLGLRLGADPRLVITTTPRAIAAVKSLIDAPGVVVTRLATVGNRHNLAPGFVEAMEAQYAGSHLARQELDGVLVEDPEGALWTRRGFGHPARARPAHRACRQ